MRNQVILTGKLVHIGHNKITIKTKDTNKRIRIKLNSNILDTSYSVGNLIAIKGFIDKRLGRLIIVGEQIINFSSSNKERR